MDGLGRLRSVQMTLQLMREHSLCSREPSDKSDDRFVADFFLFLVHSCADTVELRRRCAVLAKQLPKVSMTFLQTLVVENCAIGSRSSPDFVAASPLEKEAAASSSISRTRFSSSRNVDKNEKFVAKVGLNALQRANSTLEDFCRSYFMFHGMNVHNPQHLFKYLPILSFVEAFVYQLDEENEDQLLPPIESNESFSSQAAHGRDSAGVSQDNASSQDTRSIKADQSWTTDNKAGIGNDPFRGLQNILATRGLLTKRIELELRNGIEYWRLERVLCDSVRKGHSISLEDVIKAVKLKSFDYRVLNLLLYSLTNRQVNEAHFEFLATSELLVEISDDLFDYEDDVLKNSFNVLRMLVQVYGPIEAPGVLASLISEEEMKYQHLLGRLEPGLARRYQDRCQEATNEGGGNSKHPFGSWTIPSIVDEKKFRAEVTP